MARSIWTGSISFGLVNIPVKLMTAVREHGITLHMLSPDGKCRLRRKLVCPDTGEEFQFNETTRGYEVAPDQYVIINDEELDKLRPEAGRAIEIQEFVEQDKIDPMYYERSYYLAPDERGGKAYQLLLQALEEKDRVAIGTFVMRQKQYICALRAHKGLIVLETMRYADEVVNPEEEIGVPKHVKVSEGELKMATQLIEALAAEGFDPTKYKDEYRTKLQELIDAKAEGEEVVLHEPEDEEAPPVINLMEALQKSLASARKAGDTPSRHAKGNGRKRAASSAHTPRRRKSA